MPAARRKRRPGASRPPAMASGVICRWPTCRGGLAILATTPMRIMNKQSQPDRAPTAGPARDFVGYGRHAPRFRWPGGALVAVNLVLVYEEGAEYSLPDGDGRNDNWGEFDLRVSPA